jgi:hypothetical protein
MSKKKKTINEQQPYNGKSPLELEVLRIVKGALKDKDTEISADEIKYIVHQLLPDIDLLIANKVKQHFYELGMFLVEKFKIKE